MEADYGESVVAGGKPQRKPSRGAASSAAAGAKKISFPLEHSLGNGQFEPIGTFSGILKTSAHDSAQERQVQCSLPRWFVKVFRVSGSLEVLCCATCNPKQSERCVGCLLLCKAGWGALTDRQDAGDLGFVRFRVSQGPS